MFWRNQKKKQEKYLRSSSILLATSLTKDDTLPWVMIVADLFCNWNMFSLLPKNSINCSIWVLEMTLLKLTQYYFNICLTTYLSLTSLFLVHSGQYLLFLTSRRERQALFETHYLSSSLPINQIVWFKQKARVCLNRNLII